MTQTGHSRRRAVTRSKHRQAGDGALRQVERDNSPVLVQPTDRDLEYPVQVDPGDVPSPVKV